MKSRFVTSFVVALLAFHAAHAAPPLGKFTFEFGGENGAPVWDVSGIYAITQVLSGFEIALRFALAQDLSGKVTGEGDAIISDGARTFSGPLAVTGKVRRSSGRSEVLLDAGSTASGNPVLFAANFRLTLRIDEVTRSMSGPAHGTLSISGEPRVRLKGDVETPLPTGSDGRWTLAITTERAGVYEPDDDEDDEFRGQAVAMRASATAILSSGARQELRGVGRYSYHGITRSHHEWEGSDLHEVRTWHVLRPREARIGLRAVTQSAPARLQLRAYGEQLFLLRISGRIAGQRISLP